MLLDSNHPLDPHAGAGCGGVRPAPCVFDGEAQRFTFGGRSILQVEPHAADRRGARRHRLLEELAEAWQIVHPQLDAVAGDVAAQRLAAVVVVELGLQIVAARLDGVAAQPRALHLLQHRRHRVGVELLGLARALCPRLDAHLHPGAIRSALDAAFARCDGYRAFRSGRGSLRCG